MNKILELVMWDLTTHKRSYLLQAICALGITLAMVLISWLVSGFQQINVEGAAELILNFQMTAFAVYLTLLSAPLDGKQPRISYLMLPASMPQKYISRLIIVLVLVPLTITAATLITDGVQILLTQIMYPEDPHSSIFMEIWRTILSVLMPDDFSWMEPSSLFSFIGIIGIFLIFVSYGLMCGSLWPKRAFLKSIVLGFMLMTICFLLMGCLNFNLNVISEFLDGAIILIMLYAISFILLYIGYRAFSKRQVVDKGLITKHF